MNPPSALVSLSVLHMSHICVCLIISTLRCPVCCWCEALSQVLSHRRFWYPHLSSVIHHVSTNASVRFMNPKIHLKRCLCTCASCGNLCWHSRNAVTFWYSADITNRDWVSHYPYTYIFQCIYSWADQNHVGTFPFLRDVFLFGFNKR